MYISAVKGVKRMDGFDRKRINREELKTALGRHYGFPEYMEVSLLKYSENLTYLLKMDREKYVLRIYRPGYHDPDELYGEVLWQRRLKLDTGIFLAGVVPGKDGNLIQSLNMGEDFWNTAVFEFVPGKVLRNLTGDELYKYMEKIGEITAMLHEHVIHWKESSRLKRFSWNFEDLVGPTSRWGDYSEMKTLTDRQSRIYGAALKIIAERLEAYGKGPDRYGLIHSDLNINNILVDGDRIYVLDFDDCGFGWFLYDLSTSVLEYFGDTLNCCIKALLRGYRKHRLLTEEDEDELETFLVLRKIVRVGWIATHQDNDTVKKVDPDYYEDTAKLAAAYFEKYGRL